MYNVHYGHCTFSHHIVWYELSHFQIYLLIYFFLQNRETMERLEELETSNNHLLKRMDKLKNAKSTLLKELWPGDEWWIIENLSKNRRKSESYNNRHFFIIFLKYILLIRFYYVKWCSSVLFFIPKHNIW